MTLRKSSIRNNITFHQASAQTKILLQITPLESLCWAGSEMENYLMETIKLLKNKRITLELSQNELTNALQPDKNGARILGDLEKRQNVSSNFESKCVISSTSNIPFKSPKSGKFSFIDLFAGIGGIRIPFQELGGKCVFTSEWDKFAQKTYQVNFGEQPFGDITKIDETIIPDFDILLGGFPCQPFSQAGLRKGFADTRGTLFFDIERILAAKKPKAFLLENVKQLRGHDDGRTLNVIVQHLRSLNYFVDFAVLRAADFGVPQNRERIYIVGLDKDVFMLPKNYRFPYPEPTHKKTCLGDILDEKVDDKYTISDALWQGHIRRKKENREKGNGFGYTLFTKDSPYTNTISARYYKDGSEILIDQGPEKNPRKLTPRECARLQGFPEDFIIAVSDLQAYKQFGNSVAVPVVRYVAKVLLSEMSKLSRNKK